MIPNKTAFLVIVCFFASLQVYAQKNDIDKDVPGARSVFGEIGGPGIFSVNYDQRFKGQKGLGFRAGMGGIGFLTAGIFAFPVGLNYLSGSNGNYLELGAGASAVTISDGTTFFSNNTSAVFGYLNIGYRYQPEKKGFTGRVFVCPMFNTEGLFPFYGGISAGYKF
ncbi:MAG: hypothetical protein V4557_13570 [Bacteroidota bacterium]